MLPERLAMYLISVFLDNLVSAILDFAMKETDTVFGGGGADVQGRPGAAAGDIGRRLESRPYPVLPLLLPHRQFAFLTPFFNQCRLGRFKNNADNFMLILLHIGV